MANFRTENTHEAHIYAANNIKFKYTQISLTRRVFISVWQAEIVDPAQ